MRGRRLLPPPTSLGLRAVTATLGASQVTPYKEDCRAEGTDPTSRDRWVGEGHVSEVSRW